MSDAINHVSDTAVWVATYRGREGDRPDALFKDPLAKMLAGAKGDDIAARMSATKWVEFVVVMRTLMIDDYIRELISQGIDTFVNLGAGLDTRPYRLNLPSSVRWIEADYPGMIDFKVDKLSQEKSTVQLEHAKLDLGDDQARRAFLDRLASQSPRIAVLTEGVIPYLSEQQVDALSKDLLERESFKYWICDFQSPKNYSYLKNQRRNKEMKNAPFLFFPADWLGFFETRGWKIKQKKSYFVEAYKHNRMPPIPWYIQIVLKIFKPSPNKIPESGFMLLERR